MLSSREDFRALTRLIKEIDVPRKQVFIEATIMEVVRTLKLTPHVNDQDLIRLEIEQEMSELGASSSLGPSTSRRLARTTVFARDQQTIVIGGLTRERQVDSAQKVTLLGDITQEERRLLLGPLGVPRTPGMLERINQSLRELDEASPPSAGPSSPRRRWRPAQACRCPEVSSLTRAGVPGARAPQSA